MKQKPTAQIEHVNLTVSDPDRTAAMLERVFGWHVRWKGPSMLGGNTVHIGTNDQYLAIYSTGKADTPSGPSHSHLGSLNHVGVLVEDLDAIDRRVRSEGLETFNHETYEPGRRFYFYDLDGIEFEVVSYN